MPLFSVIIPAHNAALTIIKTLKSVESQSLSDFECIIVCDSCSDDTEAVVKAFIEGKLKYKTFNVNFKNPSKTRNFGINLAEGKYISLLDSDDWWEADKLNKHLEAFNLSINPDIVYDGTIFYKDGNKLKKCRCLPGIPTNFQILTRNPVTVGSTPSIKAELLKLSLYDDDLIQAEDGELWWRLKFKHNAVFYGINEFLTNYRVSSNSLSTDYDNHFMNFKLAIEKFKIYSIDLYKQYHKLMFAFQVNSYARRALVNNCNKKMALSFFIKSLSYEPFWGFYDCKTFFTTLCSFFIPKFIFKKIVGN